MLGGHRLPGEALERVKGWEHHEYQRTGAQGAGADSKEGNNVIVQRMGWLVNAPGENVDLEPTKPGYLMQIKELCTILKQNFFHHLFHHSNGVKCG